MPPDRRDETSMVAYLLGQLPEDEAAELESSFFLDEGLFAALCSVEAELIHAYLRGELTGPRLRRFEEVYSGSTPRGRRLAAEREWFEAAKLVSGEKRTGGAVTRTRWWRGFFSTDGAAPKFAMVSASLIAALVFGWLAHRIIGVEAALSSMRADLAARGGTPQRVASFVLTPGQTRGDSAPKRILLPGNTALVRFELQLDGPAKQQAYTATLRAVDGYEVWSGSVFPEKGTMTATLPAGVLVRNDYKLTLEARGAHAAVADAPSYVFSVVGR